MVTNNISAYWKPYECYKVEGMVVPSGSTLKRNNAADFLI
jgi:hypothetical protein